VHFKNPFRHESKTAYINRLEDLKDDIKRRNDRFDRGPVDFLAEQQDLAPSDWLAMAREAEPVAPPPRRHELPVPASLDYGAVGDEQLQAVLAGLNAPASRAA
jgi:hypothetical protein